MHKNHRQVCATLLVILCDTQSDAVEAKETIKQWLAERELELSEEKTNLTHIEKGIDFLGFNTVISGQKIA